MDVIRLAQRSLVARSVAGSLILVAGAAAGAVRGGWAAVAIALVVFLIFARRGTLVTRTLALLVVESALLIGAGLVGPLAIWVFTPAALGAVVCLPAALVVVTSAGGSKPRLRVPIEDAAVLLVAMLAAAIIAKPLIGVSDVDRLRAMTLGGPDFAAHFDLIQSVWFHKGFLFVNGGHRILEARPHLAATPHGVHVALSALGILLSGRSTLPSASALLRLFAWFNVVVDASLVAALAGMTARLLRFSRVRPTIRVIAVLLVGSVGAVGAIGALYVWGFMTFIAGLTAMVTSLVFAVTSSPGRSATDGAVVTASVVVGCLTYTLLVPALVLAFGVYLWRTRADWHPWTTRSWPIGVYAAVVVGTLALSLIPILPSSSAVSAGGGITAAPLGLVVLVGLGTLTITLGVRRLPTSIRQLSRLSLVLGVATLAFAVEGLATEGRVKYYALKVVYSWLAIALVVFVTQLAYLLDESIARNRFRPRAAAVFACAGVLAVAGAGYVGQGGPPATIRRGGVTPLVVKWALAPRYGPGAAREEWDADAVVLRALREPGPRDRLLFGPGVLLPVHNRWLAVLNRAWNSRTDPLLVRLHWFRPLVAWQLKTWLMDHPSDHQLLLLVTKRSWLRRALRATNRAGADNVQVRYLPDSAQYRWPPTPQDTK